MPQLPLVLCFRWKILMLDKNLWACQKVMAEIYGVIIIESCIRSRDMARS